MTIPTAVTPLRTVKVRPGRHVELPDDVVTEEPLEIRLAGPGQEPEPVVVTMRTPGKDFELAAGFVVTESLGGPDDIAGAGYCDAVRDDPELQYNTVTVALRHLWVPPERVRHFRANASCGVCGKASIEEVAQNCQVVPAADPMPASVVVSMPDELRRAQKAFERTGGLHAAGLFDVTGRMGVVREDVGRHNAVDKVIGHHVLEWAGRPGRPLLAGHGLMVSGRVSFEIVQKAAVAGIGLVAAVSAPTSLAIRAATDFGVGLAGFVRDGSFNVYCHPERFDLES